APAAPSTECRTPDVLPGHGVTRARLLAPCARDVGARPSAGLSIFAGTRSSGPSENVRCWEQLGRDMLTLSSSGFDPKRTSVAVGRVIIGVIVQFVRKAFGGIAGRPVIRFREPSER